MKKTTNMRAGFTMIELIFVIVIIGILAAIAMNKLSATRDDATISKIVSNSKTIVSDAKAYYTAQGLNKWKTVTVADLTDVPLYSDCANNTQVDTNASADANGATGQLLGYLCANGQQIVEIDTNDTHIEIKDGGGSGAVHDAVINNATFISIKKAVRLGGTGVNFAN